MTPAGAGLGFQTSTTRGSISSPSSAARTPLRSRAVLSTLEAEFVRIPCDAHFNAIRVDLTTTSTPIRCSIGGGCFSKLRAPAGAVGSCQWWSRLHQARWVRRRCAHNRPGRIAGARSLSAQRKVLPQRDHAALDAAFTGWSPREPQGDCCTCSTHDRGTAKRTMWGQEFTPWPLNMLEGVDQVLTAEE